MWLHCTDTTSALSAQLIGCRCLLARGPVCDRLTLVHWLASSREYHHFLLAPPSSHSHARHAAPHSAMDSVLTTGPRPSGKPKPPLSGDSYLFSVWSAQHGEAELRDNPRLTHWISVFPIPHWSICQRNDQTPSGKCYSMQNYFYLLVLTYTLRVIRTALLSVCMCSVARWKCMLKTKINAASGWRS